MISKIVVNNFPWLPNGTWEVWEETLITSGMAKWKTSFLNAISYAYTWLDIAGKKIIWATNSTIVKLMDAQWEILNWPYPTGNSYNKTLFNFNWIKDFFWIETTKFPKNNKTLPLKTPKIKIFSESYIDTYIEKNLMNIKANHFIKNSKRITSNMESPQDEYRFCEIKKLLSYSFTKKFYDTLSKWYNDIVNSKVGFDKGSFIYYVNNASIFYDDEYVWIKKGNVVILIKRDKQEIIFTFPNSLLLTQWFDCKIEGTTFSVYIEKIRDSLKSGFKKQNDFYLNAQQEYSNEITETYNKMIYHNKELNPIGVIVHTRWISANVIMEDGSVRNIDTLSRTERALYEINILAKAKQKMQDTSPILIDDFPFKLDSDDFVDYLISMASDNQIFITRTTKGDLSVKY